MKNYVSLNRINAKPSLRNILIRLPLTHTLSK
jgi:hypothetical protein